MPLAGDIIEVGRVPGWLMNSTLIVVDSAAFTTTEAIIATISFNAIIGRTYQIRFDGALGGNAADGLVNFRIREDNVSGNELQQRQFTIDKVGTFGTPIYLLGSYTAGATATKTIVVTGDEQSGANSYTLEASSTRPAFLGVYYQDG